MKKNAQRRKKRHDCAVKPGLPGSGRYGPKCSICGDLEPFHVHLEGKRIDDYFTVGRGMTDLTAARLWKDRTLQAEGKSGQLDRLLDAARRYIEENGGKLVIIGPVQIIEWPADPKHSFTLGIKCLGRKPVKPEGA